MHRRRRLLLLLIPAAAAPRWGRQDGASMHCRIWAAQHRIGAKAAGTARWKAHSKESKEGVFRRLHGRRGAAAAAVPRGVFREHQLGAKSTSPRVLPLTRRCPP